MNLIDTAGNLLHFLFVDNFTGITTLIAGSIAFWLYLSQKKDQKVNAARVVLSEIRNAERKTDEISNSLTQWYGDFPSVLPTNSWKDYSYLFASDFDQDELELINEFYGLSELIEEAVRKDNNFFWVSTEYRAQVVQGKLVELIEKALNTRTKQIDSKKLADLKLSILDTFSNDQYSYSPIKTRNLLTTYLGRTRKITTTSAGSKLKKIAHIN